MLVLPASVHATLQEWGQQRWSDEVPQQLEHHPFGAETLVLQHPKSPAQACTVMGHSLMGMHQSMQHKLWLQKGPQSSYDSSTPKAFACLLVH